MDTVRSKDGTRIAFDKQGDGPAVILVDGAMGTRSSGSKPELAKLLAQHFTAYSYDRRGRGDSEDTQPYAVDREIEDIDALIDAAGGSACLHGHSSGGCLALEAAVKLGDRVKKLAIYEAPYNDDPEAQKAWGAYIKNLTEALATNRRGDAVALFMAYVGMPAAQIEGMRHAPFWAGMEGRLDSQGTGCPRPGANSRDEWGQRCSVHAGDGQDAESGDPRRQAEDAGRPDSRRSAGSARTGPRGILCCLTRVSASLRRPRSGARLDRGCRRGSRVRGLWAR